MKELGSRVPVDIVAPNISNTLASPATQPGPQDVRGTGNQAFSRDRFVLYHHLWRHWRQFICLSLWRDSRIRAPGIRRWRLLRGDLEVLRRPVYWRHPWVAQRLLLVPTYTIGSRLIRLIPISDSAITREDRERHAVYNLMAHRFPTSVPEKIVRERWEEIVEGRGPLWADIGEDKKECIRGKSQTTHSSRRRTHASVSRALPDAFAAAGT